MKLFGSFKLTDRIRIGASSGGKKSKGLGCGAIFLILCIICIPISLIKSCVGGNEEKATEPTTIVSESGIEAFDFNRDEFELEAGETDSSWVRVEGTEDFSIDDIIFVSSDESVVTFEYDSTSLDTYLYFNITAVSPGTATVHVETTDGKIKSDEIAVTVLEAETTTEKETTTKEKTTAAPVAAQTEATTKKPTTTAKPVTEKTEYVLNTNTKRIHNPHCSSVEDIKPENYATTKDFDGAIADGYKPCGRCHPTGD